MPTYLQDRAAANGNIEELEIDPRTARACTPGWDIDVIAWMPQKGITMKMKAGVILGQQLAVQAERFLETIDKSCYPVTGSVGRRGTNQLRLVKRYLDVLVKHTTEIPPPTALVEVCPRLPQ